MRVPSDSRVVVTGLGVVSPVGNDRPSFWDALCRGRGGVTRITRFDVTQYRSQVAAEVKGWERAAVLQDRDVARMDRSTQFAVAAGDEALSDAGLTPEGLDQVRSGVIVGSGIGGSETIEEGYRILSSKGPRAIGPLFVSKLLVNTAASMLSIRYGLRGPMSALSLACSTGTDAIGRAYRTIQYGEADLMLAGGVEACITPLAFAGFCATRSLSTRNDDPERASRPFDRDRDGFVIVVLERLDRALERSARIYAELVGYANTADGFHLTAPDPQGRGMSGVMQGALEDAGVEPGAVDYINAHGTSTVLNDRIESQAVLKFFGEHAWDLKVSSIKSMIGHLMAASGAVEFVATVLSVFTGDLPPTINHQNRDPDCPLDYVTTGCIHTEPRIALNNSFGFGGGNSCLVVKRYDE
jgi:3-oxoacyl-[acyl-carrier-protein] synthase II